MRENEFEKLDQFMERNVPLMSKTILETKNVRSRKTHFLEYGIALGISFIIVWGVIDRHNSNMRSAVELTETIEWDIDAYDDADDSDFVAILE